MTIPEEYSLVSSDKEDVLASGPFVIEATIDGVPFHDLGFDLRQVDSGGVSWSGFERLHFVQPTDEPVLAGLKYEFTDPDGSTWRLRPLSIGDGAMVGYESPSIPANEDETRDAVKFLAEYLYQGYLGNVVYSSRISEDNLYVTHDKDGEPLALVKMSASHPTFLRQDGVWRQLNDDEDDLLGDSDAPVREEAVIAWDSGNLQDLERLLLDDRFSPSEVTNVWLEVGDTDDLERLLIERSRGRFYERTREGKWTPARPKKDAATVDVIWSAISAWDTGDLKYLAQAEEYDVDGDAA